MIALVVVGVLFAAVGGYTLLKSQSVLRWNERGSAKLGRAMGIDDRQERQTEGQGAWAKAAGAIILITGIALAVAGLLAM